MYNKQGLEDRHPGTLHLWKMFEYSHLTKGQIKDTSISCATLALDMIMKLPDGPELSAGLRHLLEAKDCFVRSMVWSLKDEK